jgi:DegV family protein with EDD domain
MSNPVAVVIDSTSSIPEELRAELNITIAPNLLLWSGETLQDGVDIQPTDFYIRLESSKELPTTSQVTPVKMGQLFDNLLDQGFDVLAILMSPTFSGTYQSGLIAQRDRPEKNIVVLDSTSSGMGSGWVAVAAARAAAGGADLAVCQKVAEAAIPNVGVLGMLDTLKYLHRSGRIGGARRYLGTALRVKPILEIADSQILPVEQVRTKKKALPRLVEITQERIGERTPVRLAVMHANSLKNAQIVYELAKKQLQPIEIIMTELSPALGTNFGEGTIGLCYLAGVE